MTGSKKPGDPNTTGSAELADLAAPEFLAALLADGDDDMAAWILGQAMVERPRAEVYDEVVRPAMEVVGDRWESGQWSISVEHLASVALSGALARLRPADEPESRVGPTAVLATPAGEHHSAGLACLAQVLEDDGWHVENLGPNVPADDLVGFVSSRNVDLIALSIGTADSLPTLRRTIDALAAGGPGASLPIMVGGRGIAGLDGPIGTTRLCRSLVDAQKLARELRPSR